jgi:hypothetical protein
MIDWGKESFLKMVSNDLNRNRKAVPKQLGSFLPRLLVRSDLPILDKMP